MRLWLNRRTVKYVLTYNSSNSITIDYLTICSGSSLHFSVVNSHLWVRHDKLVCRHDLAQHQSFSLTGVRLTLEASGECDYG